MKKLKSILLLVSLLFLTLYPLAFTGCGSTPTLPPGDTIYHGDSVLLKAEQYTRNAYDLMNTFATWEYQYRPILPVEVSRAADVMRKNGRKWIDSMIAARDAYEGDPTSANRDKLDTALRLIDTALAQAAIYMADNQAKAPNQGLKKL